MSKGSYVPNSIDRARDELFSHIRRCGVLEAEDDQRNEWFDDTIQYIGERYPELTPGELTDLRTIGERYCAPAIPHGGGKEKTGEQVQEDQTDPPAEAEAEAEVEAEAEAEDVEAVDTGEASAA